MSFGCRHRIGLLVALDMKPTDSALPYTFSEVKIC